jgi:hypothetical protein
MKEKGKRLDIIIGSYKRIERIHKKVDFIKNNIPFQFYLGMAKVL